MAMAVHEMIVDHARRLHKGVDDRRTDKIGAAFAQILGDRYGNVRLRDDVLDRFARVLNRPAVDEIPQMPREAAVLAKIERDARQRDRCLNLGAIPHDARVLHQRLDLRIIVAHDLLRLETVEGGAEGVALAQDRDPGKTGLKTIEDQLLKERAVVPFGDAPFLVMINDIKGIMARPRTAAAPVRVQDRRVDARRSLDLISFLFLCHRTLRIRESPAGASRPVKRERHSRTEVFTLP